MSGWSTKEPRVCRPIEVVAQTGRHNQGNHEDIWAWRDDVKKALLEQYPSHKEKEIELAISIALDMHLVKEEEHEGRKRFIVT